MSPEAILSAIPDDFPNTSRVWIYQSSRRFTGAQQHEIDEQLHQFYAQWTAHGEPVKGWAKLLFSQFIVVIADLSQTVVSGCSMDAMEMVIKSIERQYETRLFERLTLTFLVKNEPQMLPLNQVQYAIDKGHIHADTLLFDNTISDLGALKTHWLVPVSQTWLAQRVSFSLSQ